MTPETLQAALGIGSLRAQTWADPLSAAMALYAIDSPARQAAFIAQVGHESGRLVYVRELWGPTPTQERYERAFSSEWSEDDPRNEKAFELGNTEPGDGLKYRGRGLIQVTGRANYATCGAALCLPLVDSPELLETPSNAAQSAAWFWNSRSLNDLADIGDFNTITKRINGGLNGLQDRLALYAMCKSALGDGDGT